MPVFPGTNCEYDMERKFLAAGADVDIFVVKNLSASDIEYSAAEIVKRVSKANILAFPGGFSGGDEPDGSGKFIAATFRHTRIADAVMELVKRRDGLIIGICNGFQALVKLGLLPYGEIKPMTAVSATLTFNTIGRHVSRICGTRIVSKLSPWLARSEFGGIYTVPVSHGEGRFVMPAADLRAIFKAGQVFSQYAGLDGNATMEYPYNPNGSMCAVEGITSADGRILGKMGHIERIGNSLYKNVPGNYDPGIFEAGVNYFR